MKGRHCLKHGQRRQQPQRHAACEPRTCRWRRWRWLPAAQVGRRGAQAQRLQDHTRSRGACEDASAAAGRLDKGAQRLRAVWGTVCHCCSRVTQYVEACWADRDYLLEVALYAASLKLLVAFKHELLALLDTAQGCALYCKLKHPSWCGVII